MRTALSATLRLLGGGEGGDDGGGRAGGGGRGSSAAVREGLLADAGRAASAEDTARMPAPQTVADGIGADADACAGGGIHGIVKLCFPDGVAASTGRALGEAVSECLEAVRCERAAEWGTGGGARGGGERRAGASRSPLAGPHAAGDAAAEAGDAAEAATTDAGSGGDYPNPLARRGRLVITSLMAE